MELRKSYIDELEREKKPIIIEIVGTWNTNFRLLV